MYLMGGNQGRGYWAKNLSLLQKNKPGRKFKKGKKIKIKKKKEKKGRKKGIKGISEEDSVDVVTGSHATYTHTCEVVDPPKPYA